MLDFYWAWLKFALISQAQYRAALALWLLYRLVEPMIYLSVWSAVAQSSGGSVVGYRTVDFASYYVISVVVNHLTFTWHLGWYDYLIRSGELSHLLLRPVHPIYADIADNLASKSLTVNVMIPLIGALFVIYPVRVSLPYLPAFLVTVILAFALRFMLEYAVGLLAFWIVRLAAFSQVYFTAMLFFSGKLTPIALLPDGLQPLALKLPFYWMFGFPIETLLGRLSSAEVGQGCLIQLVFLGLSAAAAWGLWRAGVRRYTSVGG